MAHWSISAGLGLMLAGAWAFFAQASWIAAAAVGLFFATLAVLAMIDFKTMLLPDKLTLPLVWAGLLFNMVGGFVPLDQAVLGAVVGYLSLWCLFWVVALATGKVGLGYGDFKLLAAIGAWVGYMPLMEVMLAASLSSLVYLSCKKLNGTGDFSTPFPFGPFIALGAVLAVFMR